MFIPSIEIHKQVLMSTRVETQVEKSDKGYAVIGMHITNRCAVHKIPEIGRFYDFLTSLI